MKPALYLIPAFIIGNFALAWLVGDTWMVAFERSYFQAVAVLMTLWVTLK